MSEHQVQEIISADFIAYNKIAVIERIGLAFLAHHAVETDPPLGYARLPDRNLANDTKDMLLALTVYKAAVF